MTTQFITKFYYDNNFCYCYLYIIYINNNFYQLSVETSILDTCDVAVIGGGIYGCAIADFISGHGHSVVIFEKEKSLMSHASFNNQGRIHRGYHYPRSFLTGSRSQASYLKFIEKFQDCCVSADSYYGIAKTFSKVSSSQFIEYCRKIDVPFAPAGEFANLLNEQLIESTFKVEEVIFNSHLLMNKFSELLKKENVIIKFNTEIYKIRRNDQTEMLELFSKNGELLGIAKKVYLCVYASTCSILNNSGIACPQVKNEWTEMALIKVPEKLKNINFTLMDGQFFSLMKFPAYNCHTLSHVRFTPHYSWGLTEVINNLVPELQKKSNFNYMIKDASRFIPLLEKAEYIDSIWEIKTILQLSESNDSRPILFKRDIGLLGLNLVLGGKVDNIFDIIAEIQGEYEK